MLGSFRGPPGKPNGTNHEIARSVRLGLTWTLPHRDSAAVTFRQQRRENVRVRWNQKRCVQARSKQAGVVQDAAQRTHHSRRYREVGYQQPVKGIADGNNTVARVNCLVPNRGDVLERDRTRLTACALDAVARTHAM